MHPLILYLKSEILSIPLKIGVPTLRNWTPMDLHSSAASLLSQTTVKLMCRSPQKLSTLLRGRLMLIPVSAFIARKLSTASHRSFGEVFGRSTCVVIIKGKGCPPDSATQRTAPCVSWACKGLVVDFDAIHESFDCWSRKQRVSVKSEF